MAERTVGAVTSLIPNELTAFDGFDSRAEYAGNYWHSPPGSVPMERVQLFGELVHEHPYFKDALATQSHQTFRTSDYLQLNQFHRTTLFNEFYRIFEGEAQMASAMRLGPESLITCSLHRPKLDFSDREVTLLGLLTPHIAAAFRNSRAFDHMRLERDLLSRSANKGLIVLGFDYSIRFMSERSAQMLERHFPDQDLYDLPDELDSFVKAQEWFTPGKEKLTCPEVFCKASGFGELSVHLAYDGTLREMTLLLAEKRELALQDLRGIGLSNRETEIVLWLCRGKSDASIAVLCGITTRTVQKHVENILTKLGVENRANVVSIAYHQMLLH